MSTQQNRLSIKQLAQAFNVSTMTLYLWRQGTPTKDPLPCIVEDPTAGKPRISFKIAPTKAWARKHGLEFAVDPSALIASTEGRAKPGPKQAKQPPNGHGRVKH